MQIEYVLVENAKGFANQIIQRQKDVERWGTIYVMPEKSWANAQREAQVLLEKATSGQKLEWNRIRSLGTHRYGYWLKGARKDDVSKVARPFSKGLLLWVTPEGYFEIRRRLFDWILQCQEQRGFAAVPPRENSWVSSAYCTPEEAREYRRLVSSQSPDPRKLQVLKGLCDPHGLIQKSLESGKE